MFVRPESEPLNLGQLDSSHGQFGASRSKLAFTLSTGELVEKLS